MKQITNLNTYIDHTLLRSNATSVEIEQLVNEAIQYQFHAVCINPCHVSLAKKLLDRSNVAICTVIGFPLGANTTNTKIHETCQAINDGANEIDMVINIGALKENNQDLVLNEIREIKKVCAKKAILKVIIETSYLSEAEKITACILVKDAQADFIKTSTGFSGGGATIADVALMKKHLGSHVAIKASGGIKCQEDALKLIAAGASRIGTSNGISIISNQNITNNY